MATNPQVPEIPENNEKYNTYIGMRYVPLIYGEWNNTKAYEPLTIVTYQGNSYTSKTYVPIGANIKDTTYWVVTGNYNAQVEAYRQEVIQYKAEVDNVLTTVNEHSTQITNLQTDLTATTARVTTNEGNIATNTSNIATNTTNITNTNTQINNRRVPVIKGANLVFIGDSWTVGSGASPSTNRFSTLLAGQFKMVEKNFGVGASGFTITNNLFSTQLDTANAQMTTEEKNNTPLVLITGGVNDLRHMPSSAADFAQAVEDCARKAYSIFPNATIAMAVSNTTMNGYTETMQNYVAQAINRLYLIHTVPLIIIKNVGASINGRPSMYQSDNLHPTNVGHSVFAGFLANAIMGGGSDVYYYHSMPEFSTGITADVPPHVFRDNNMVRMTAGHYNFSTAITSNTVIGTLGAEITPKQSMNCYVPFYSGNTIVGTFAITESGSVRVIPNPQYGSSSQYPSIRT